jgi:hypothetical protein
VSLTVFIVAGRIRLNAQLNIMLFGLAVETGEVAQRIPSLMRSRSSRIPVFDAHQNQAGPGWENPPSVSVLQTALNHGGPFGFGVCR